MIPRKLFLLLVFMAIIGCNQSDTNTDNAPANKAEVQSESEPQRTGKILARVNGSPIYEEDLNGKNLDFVINEEIIYQVALQQGLDKETRDKVKEFEKRLVVREVKADILENSGLTKKISNEEIEDYYEKNKDIYAYIRIHEIAFPDSSLGEEIKEKVEKGQDLQEIANSYRDVAVTVTDVGFDRGLAKEFSSKKVGSVSDVIQKPNGQYSVLKIVELREIPLKVTKKSIRNLLEAKHTAQMYDEYAKEAAEQNNIEVEIIQ